RFEKAFECSFALQPGIQGKFIYKGVDMQAYHLGRHLPGMTPYVGPGFVRVLHGIEEALPDFFFDHSGNFAAEVAPDGNRPQRERESGLPLPPSAKVERHVKTVCLIGPS